MTPSASGWMPSAPASARALVGSGDRSERIRTYNYPQGRVTDHRINLTLYNLSRIVSGDELGEIVDALVAQDQADRLAEYEASRQLTLDEATRLLAAAGIDSPRAEARLLLAHALGISREATLTATPTPDQAARFAAAVSRRAGARTLRLHHRPQGILVAGFRGRPRRAGAAPRYRDADRGSAARWCPIARAAAPSPIWAPAPAPSCCAALKEFPNASGIGFEIARRRHSPMRPARNRRAGLIGPRAPKIRLDVDQPTGTRRRALRPGVLQPALYSVRRHRITGAGSLTFRAARGPGWRGRRAGCLSRAGKAAAQHSQARRPCLAGNRPGAGSGHGNPVSGPEIASNCTRLGRDSPLCGAGKPLDFLEKPASGD